MILEIIIFALMIIYIAVVVSQLLDEDMNNSPEVDTFLFLVCIPIILLLILMYGTNTDLSSASQLYGIFLTSLWIINLILRGFALYIKHS